MSPMPPQMNKSSQKSPKGRAAGKLLVAMGISPAGGPGRGKPEPEEDPYAEDEMPMDEGPMSEGETVAIPKKAFEMLCSECRGMLDDEMGMGEKE